MNAQAAQRVGEPWVGQQVDERVFRAEALGDENRVAVGEVVRSGDGVEPTRFERPGRASRIGQRVVEVIRSGDCQHASESDGRSDPFGAQPWHERLPSVREEQEKKRQHDDVTPRADSHGERWRRRSDQGAEQSDPGERLVSPAPGGHRSENQRDRRGHEEKTFESGGVTQVAVAADEQKEWTLVLEVVPHRLASAADDPVLAEDAHRAKPRGGGAARDDEDDHREHDRRGDGREARSPQVVAKREDHYQKQRRREEARGLGGETGRAKRDAGREPRAETAITAGGQGPQRQHVKERREEIGLQHRSPEVEEPRLERRLEHEDQCHRERPRQPPAEPSCGKGERDAGDGVGQPDDPGRQREKRCEQRFEVDAGGALVVA